METPAPKDSRLSSEGRPPKSTLRSSRSSSLSWEAEVRKYLEGTHTDQDHPCGSSTKSGQLAQEVLSNPESASVWWNFLLHEERISTDADRTCSRGRSVTLGDLYRWATRVVPRQSNYKTTPFINIWLGHARQQWHRNGADDARDTFKALKSQHIGEQYAPLYAEWAGLEAKDGNASKSRSIIAKGLRERAQPLEMLEQIERSLSSGNFVYAPFWELIEVFASERKAFEEIQDCRNNVGAADQANVPCQRSSTATLKTPRNNEMGASSGFTTPAIAEQTNSFQSASHVDNKHHTMRVDAKAMTTPNANNSSMCDAWKQQATETYLRHKGHACDGFGRLDNARNSDVSSVSSGSSQPLRSSSKTQRSSTNGCSGSSDGSTAPLKTRTPANRTVTIQSGTLSMRSSSTNSGEEEELTVNLHHNMKPNEMITAAVRFHGDKPAHKLLNTSISSACSASISTPGAFGALGRAMRVTTPAEGSHCKASAISDEDETAARLHEAEISLEDPSSLSVPENRSCSNIGGKKRNWPATDPQGPSMDGESCSGNHTGRLKPIPEHFHPINSSTSVSQTTLSVERRARDAAPLTGLPGHSQDRGLQIVIDGVDDRKATFDGVAHDRSQNSKQRQEHGDEEDETIPLSLKKENTKPNHAQTSSKQNKCLAEPPTSLGASGLRTDGPADGELRLVQARSSAIKASSRTPLSSRRNQPNEAVQSRTKPTARANSPVASRNLASSNTFQERTVMGPPPPPPPHVAAHATANKSTDPERIHSVEDQVALMKPPQSQSHRNGATPSVAHKVPARAVAETRGRVIEDENIAVVRGITYSKLECVGRGGSSKVYKVMAPNRKIFAMKRIRLNGRDKEATSGFLDEITLLAKLRGRSNIIQLIDSEVHQKEGLIYMVLEFGDIDLAKLLQRHEKSRRERLAELEKSHAISVTSSQTKEQQYQIDENFIRLYWEQMLCAVDTIHRERIVHSDLKPANFLVVEGQLKLIDFGIAKAIQNDTTSIARESQVGTLNYMSPEAILGGNSAPRSGGPIVKVGRASDIWSLGCILYQMVYGKTPFAHLPFIQKMHAIIDENHQIEFPRIRNSYLLDVMQRCLDRNPKMRITMAELLDHPFLRPEQSLTTPDRSGSGTASGSWNTSAGLSGSIELSQEQLRKLLFKISKAGVSDADVCVLSEKLFQQLSRGQLSPDIISKKAGIGQGNDDRVYHDDGNDNMCEASRRTPLAPLPQGPNASRDSKDRAHLLKKQIASEGTENMAVSAMNTR